MKNSTSMSELFIDFMIRGRIPGTSMVLDFFDVLVFGVVLIGVAIVAYVHRRTLRSLAQRLPDGLTEIDLIAL